MWGRPGQTFASVALVLLCVGASALPARGDENPVPNPRYVEREVEFMWLEGRYVWSDTFRVRAYPRVAEVGSQERISLRIRRTRDGVGKTPPEPLKVECTVRREGGGQWVYTADKPGHEVAFGHEIERRGDYVASVVTYYSDEETYTVSVRFSAE